MRVNIGHRPLSSKPLRGSMRRAGLSVASLVVTAAVIATAWSARAQQIPGVIIAPSPGSSTMQPPSQMPGIMIAPSPSAQPQPLPPQQQQAPVAAPKQPPRVKKQVAIAKPKDDGAEAGDSGLVKGPGSTRIGLLVNGEPITAYEIEQRARLMALGADIQSRAQAAMKQLATSEAVNARWKQIVQETVTANQGKTREQIIAIIQDKQKAYSMGLQKQAIESARAASIPAKRDDAKKELIEEIVKLQDARRNGATPDEAMVEDLVKDIAQRNKMSSAEFTRHFASMGVDIMTLKAKFRAQLGWTDAVRKQYSHLTQPSQRELDQALVNFTGGEDKVELQLQRIVLPVPAKVDQKAMAQRLSEAEQVQRQFKDCKSTVGLAAGVQGARFENLGTRSASSFTEPSRTLLLSATENTMIPPSMTSSGIELIAVCGRTVIKALEVERTKIAGKGRQEQFELLSRNHMRKLMDSAIIENR